MYLALGCVCLLFGGVYMILYIYYYLRVFIWYLGVCDCNLVVCICYLVVFLYLRVCISYSVVCYLFEPKGPPTRSQGPEAPRLLVIFIIIYDNIIKQVHQRWRYITVTLGT